MASLTKGGEARAAASMRPSRIDETAGAPGAGAASRLADMAADIMFSSLDRSAHARAAAAGTLPALY